MKRLLFKKMVDNTESQSIASNMRRKRLELFNQLVATIPRPIKILDVGGTQTFWDVAGLAAMDDFEFTLLNVYPNEISLPNFTSVVGDATNMNYFDNDQFDIVFSNSVIEHVGDVEKQKLMSNEIKRVGKRYFVQTPNRYFPLEPHFVFPLFQFFPVSLRVLLVRHFNLGWISKTPDRQDAVKIVKSINLLSETDLTGLFSEAELFKEKLLGMTKSFIVYDGW